MKKMMATLLVAAVAGMAVADISITANSGSGSSKLILKEGLDAFTGLDSVIDNGAFVQLVWAADDTGYKSDNLDLSLVNPGEVILASGAANNFGGTFAFENGIWGDAVVGSDILAGVFYARVFETAAPTKDDFFVEMGIEMPTLTEFDALVATSTYSDAMNQLGANTSIDSQGTTVIPEPATLGLMGVAGLGMFLARKKARA